MEKKYKNRYREKIYINKKLFYKKIYIQKKKYKYCVIKYII